LPLPEPVPKLAVDGCGPTHVRSFAGTWLYAPGQASSAHGWGPSFDWAGKRAEHGCAAAVVNHTDGLMPLVGEQVARLRLPGNAAT
jgi:hypothetical protein